MENSDKDAAATQPLPLGGQAAATDGVVVAGAAWPVTRVAPASASQKRVLGMLRGTIEIPDDFDSPLSADMLALFEGDSLG